MVFTSANAEVRSIRNLLVKAGIGGDTVVDANVIAGVVIAIPAYA